jgi:hypothetical protein
LPVVDIRALLADQLGCAADEFTMRRKPVEGYRGIEADYGATTGTIRVLITNARGAAVRSENHAAHDLHRRVVVTWRGGQAEIRIGVDDEVRW